MACQECKYKLNCLFLSPLLSHSLSLSLSLTISQLRTHRHFLLVLSLFLSHFNVKFVFVSMELSNPMFETPRAFSVDVRTPWTEVTQIPEFYFKIRLSLSLSSPHHSHTHKHTHSFHTLHYKDENIGGRNEMEWENEVKTQGKHTL